MLGVYSIKHVSGINAECMGFRFMNLLFYIHSDLIQAGALWVIISFSRVRCRKFIISYHNWYSTKLFSYVVSYSID